MFEMDTPDIIYSEIIIYVLIFNQVNNPKDARKINCPSEKALSSRVSIDRQMRDVTDSRSAMSKG